MELQLTYHRDLNSKLSHHQLLFGYNANTEESPKWPNLTSWHLGDAVSCLIILETYG